MKAMLRLATFSVSVSALLRDMYTHNVEVHDYFSDSAFALSLHSAT